MSRFRDQYRKLDALQRTFRFRVIASIVALALCAVTFGPLVYQSNDLHVRRQLLIDSLTGQNLEDGDEHARSLANNGTVTVAGHTYGGERFAARTDIIFNSKGEIDLPDELAEALLVDTYPTWVPKWLLEQPRTTWMLALLGTGWLLLIVWLGVTLPFLLTALGTGVPALSAWWLGAEQTGLALAGIGLLTFTFVVLMRAAQVVLDRPDQMLAVAHTVIREAGRTRIPLVFIVIILILLPLLPFGLDAESPLRFRIQTFISRSLGFTFYLAACMTLFLSCATVAFEIRDRQIWQLTTKPLNRLNYLLGKWLGVITVNLIILVIAAVSSFTFIQFLRTSEVAPGLRGQLDAQQVTDAVLTARIGVQPEYEELDAEQLRQRVDQIIERDPDLSAMETVPPITRRKLAEEVQQVFFTGQRSIPPNGVHRNYLFTGLQEARRHQSSLTLRYRFHIRRDDQHEVFPAVFVFNEDPNVFLKRQYVPTMSHVLTIPSRLIREDGTMLISVINLHEPPPEKRGYGALNFEADDFELLYKVSSFEANFFRAVLVDWVKLAFLAMLGICCATFLNFPVACLMSFTIFIAGTIGPFLAESMPEFRPPPFSAIDHGNIGLLIRWTFDSFITLIADSLVFLLDAFGRYRPTQSLVEGRLIPWSTVGGAALWIGVIWSCVALIPGFLVFRKRQLAIYSGHG